MQPRCIHTTACQTGLLFLLVGVAVITDSAWAWAEPAATSDSSVYSPVVQGAVFRSVMGTAVCSSRVQVPSRSVACRTVLSMPKTWRRGMTVSCFGWGAEWATPQMYDAMAELRSHGVNWISFHPYAWIRDHGQLVFSRSVRQATVLLPMQFAQKLGLQVLLKPHIGYWGSSFGWRGDIRFSQESEWQRFFRNYQTWIVTQAAMAQRGKAAFFSVGVEYKQTLHREKDWRRIIAAVRQVYRGRLTYSANWDSFHRVPFWDALDEIGIQAYFPLSTQPNPSEEELRKGWKLWMQRVCEFSLRHKKPVVFTEVGYNRSSLAAAKPWEHAEGGALADNIKLRCLKVALEEIPKYPCMRGVFFWKWFPSSARISSNYTLQYPAMTRMLRACWRSNSSR